MSELTYKKSGVDINEGNRFVNLIKPLVARTFRKEVLTGIGSFGALFNLDLSRYRNPVLVSGTDGVGTKLKVAFLADRHDTVGIDLVAMCVNDILTSGAEPLFFLDYFATGRLLPEKAAKVVEGIVKGCEDAGCSLIGGETAEMPGFYSDGEYDLSGFAVGAVNRDDIVDGSSIREGDTLVGIASNGLHSNGYSLVRKLFFDTLGMKADTNVPEFGSTLGDELLRPTSIYVKVIDKLMSEVTIKGMSHITGGGITENVPRMIPSGLGVEIKRGSWDIQPIFKVIQERGDVSEEEMFRTFNMGIGYVLAVSEGDSTSIVDFLDKNGYKSYIIGTVNKSGGEVLYV